MQVSGVVRKAGVESFGKFRGYKLVEHLGGRIQRERVRGLAAGGQVAATAVNGEGDDEALRPGFDGGMVFTAEGSAEYFGCELFRCVCPGEIVSNSLILRCLAPPVRSSDSPNWRELLWSLGYRLPGLFRRRNQPLTSESTSP